MALSATTIWEVETTGSDTLNGGAFDPGQTAGMFTDGAATSATGSAPVFTSASYNFIAGDVGAWVFVSSGTNWTPGWYKVASVASNAATLNATIGQAVVSAGVAGSTIAIGLRPSLVLGCATTASPTGATWSIDYSQQAAAQFTYTDLVSAGAGLTISSAAKPFAKQQVGNSIVVTGGTNFTTGRYVIASVAAITFIATVVGPTNITTGVGAAGTGGLGGAVASPGLVGGVIVASNQCFIQTGTYTVTSATINIAVGCWSTSLASLTIEGYNSVRGDLTPVNAAGTRPTVVASGISTFTLFALGALGTGVMRHVIVDSAALTASRSVDNSGGTFCTNVHVQNCKNGGFVGAVAVAQYHRCSATGCSTTSAAFATNGTHVDCVAYSNSVAGFNAGGFVPSTHVRCIAYANSGATTDGFSFTNQNPSFVNCVSYGNGRDGFRSTFTDSAFINCVAEGNTGAGFTCSSVGAYLLNCAAYTNSGGASTFTSATHLLNTGFITGTASFFANPGSGNFALNGNAGGGALLRETGYPGVFPVGLTTGYLDIGAAQTRDVFTGFFIQ